MKYDCSSYVTSIYDSPVYLRFIFPVLFSFENNVLDSGLLAFDEVCICDHTLWL